MLALLVNSVIGLVKHPTRAKALPAHMTAPTTAPMRTLADIRAAAAQELPGARIRRRLFWRYTLVYDVAAERALDMHRHPGATSPTAK